MFNEAIWKEGERLVKEYMEDLGYKILYTNYSCVGVELDIVATISVSAQKKEIKGNLKNLEPDEDGRKKRKKMKENLKNLTPLLVITEVKTRSNNKYGTGKDAVSSLKKIHLKRGAEFLLRQEEFKDMQVRIDVASVDNGKIEYIEDALQCK